MIAKMVTTHIVRIVVQCSACVSHKHHHIHYLLLWLFTTIMWDVTNYRERRNNNFEPCKQIVFHVNISVVAEKRKKDTQMRCGKSAKFHSNSLMMLLFYFILKQRGLMHWIKAGLWPRAMFHYCQCSFMTPIYVCVWQIKNNAYNNRTLGRLCSSFSASAG